MTHPIPVPSQRYAGICSHRGQRTETGHGGLVACKWGRCNGTVHTRLVAPNA